MASIHESLWTKKRVINAKVSATLLPLFFNLWTVQGRAELRAYPEVKTAGQRQDMHCWFTRESRQFSVHPQTLVGQTGFFWGKIFLSSLIFYSPCLLGLPELANKNTGHPFIVCNILTLKNYLLFIWNLFYWAPCILSSNPAAVYFHVLLDCFPIPHSLLYVIGLALQDCKLLGITSNPL